MIGCKLPESFWASQYESPWIDSRGTRKLTAHPANLTCPRFRLWRAIVTAQLYMSHRPFLLGNISKTC